MTSSSGTPSSAGPASSSGTAPLSAGVGAPAPRLPGIDALRLLAALCVVALHVDTSSFPFFGGPLDDQLRLAARWAVPYFFLVTGFFLARRPPEEALRIALPRALLVAAVANALLLPYDWRWEGGRATLARLATPDVLALGVQVHLWYLSANVLALLVLLAIAHYRAWRVGWLVGAAVWLLLCATGAYWPTAGSGFVTARAFLGVPCMLAGMALARRTPGRAASWLLVAAGLALQALESRLLSAHWGTRVHDYEFLAGTLPLAIGVFGLGQILRGEGLLQRIASLGARCALGVYVLHPYLLQAGGVWLAGKGRHDAGSGFVLLALGFAVTLCGLWLLDRVAPRCLGLLAGDPRAWGRPGSLRA